MVDGKSFQTKLRINGIYNIFNVAAAICLVRVICSSKLNTGTLIECLENIQPAFGRGEVIKVAGQPLELILVKNPVGFRLGLKSFQAKDAATMIAINDNYADGRDMSWLWDVDFSSLAPKVAVVSGIRAYDMALRLQYDGIEAEFVESSLSKALNKLITANANKPKRIYCTYTAMLELRGYLRKITKMERVL